MRRAYGEMRTTVMVNRGVASEPWGKLRAVADQAQAVACAGLHDRLAGKTGCAGAGGDLYRHFALLRRVPFRRRPMTALAWEPAGALMV